MGRIYINKKCDFEDGGMEIDKIDSNLLIYLMNV